LSTSDVMAALDRAQGDAATAQTAGNGG